MKIFYHKLVRDGIPEIVRKQGNRCATSTLSDAEYLVAVYRKMQEELADLLEAVRAAAVARGYTVEELERARAEKEARRGSFRERIFLQYVEQ